jgi:hypothetical protein
METTSDTDDIGIQIVPLHGNHFRTYKEKNKKNKTSNNMISS